MAIELLGSWVGGAEGEESSGKAITILSTMVGAVVLSRAVNDEQLSKQFLQAPVKSLMGLSAGAAQKDSSDDDGLSSRVPRPVAEPAFGNLFTAKGRARIAGRCRESQRR